jgi:hypothetical protein
MSKLHQVGESDEPVRVRWARNFIERFGGENAVLKQVQREFLKTAREIVARYDRTTSLEVESDAKEAA